MKILTRDGLDAFVAGLAPLWDVRLPIRLPDGTRAMGAPGSGPVDLFGGAVPGKPTAAFFPQQGTIFTVAGGEVQEQADPARPLFMLGFTPRDLSCLRFIDRFFADGWRDDLYFRLRQNAVVAGISGWCGLAGALLPPAEGDCDLEFFWDGACWLVIPYSQQGTGLAALIEDDAPDAAMDRFRQTTSLPPDEQVLMIRRASEILRYNNVPDTFWAEIGDRCIACTGCNLACPTCTCFGVQDWRSATGVERSRMWDSCQLDGFMREAGGA